MQEPKLSYPKVALIGAGGISCQLLPLLSLDRDVVLVDGDKFEPHNSTRQFPALSSEGNKAEILAEMQNDRTTKQILPISEYLKGLEIINRDEWEGVSLMIGAVDNNESRVLITKIAEELDIPAILCGNEVNVGESHLFLPGAYNPFDHYDFGELTPAPYSCTSDDQAESAPQTGTANHLAAACGLFMLSALEQTTDKKYLPVNVSMDIRAGVSRTRLCEKVEIT